MKKITVDKTDGIAEVIDRILAVDDGEITLVIPRGSALAKSLSNFRLLKREADLADKKIAIESVDDVILAFAKESGIGHTHSFLKHAQIGGSVSDIVAKRGISNADGERDEEEHTASVTKHPAKDRPVKLAVQDDDNEDEDADSRDDETSTDDEQEESNSRAESFFNKNNFFKERSRSSGDDEDDEPRGSSWKGVGWTIGIIVVLGAIFFFGTKAFGRATVTIDFTQTPWSYQGNFTADKSVTAIDPVNNVIPAQLFSSQKNITQLFPATGQSSANASVKARGTITIYNDYSAAPQELVATTRFVTPDGKLFRLVGNITVPGAQVASNGTITPSSITAPIIADQGGAAYNVGPVAKLTIPGFQGTARYNGFYGAILGQTSGGYVGTSTVVTASDIASAKASTTAILEADLQNDLATSYSNNFKILDGATNIQVTKLTVSTTTDQNGNFSIFGEASLSAIGFDEAAFKAYLLSLAQTTEASSSFKSITLNYSNVQANFTTGQVSFALSAQGSLEPAFSGDDFASSIAGESITDARSAIGGLPELSDGKISVWPMWLWSIPSNPNKIQVTVN